MGPSGSGKSTLLAFAGGFLDAAFDVSGRILIDGTDLTAVPANRRHAGILFQDPLLFPHSIGRRQHRLRHSAGCQRTGRTPPAGR